MSQKTLHGKAKNHIQKSLDESEPSKILSLEIYDDSDPGDETQRNFRYQHAYGVILLVAAITKQKLYQTLWCEHHEDFLAECDDGLYEAWQIKTRKRENGAWQLNTDALRDSICRFVKLEKRYPGKIKGYYFASNAEISESQDKQKIGNSPSIFLHAVRDALVINGEIKLDDPFGSSFEQLRKHCECSVEELLSVLRKLDFIKGPERESFEDEIAHTHLPKIPGCQSLSPPELNGLRDELIQVVYKASSLKVADPAKHYYCLGRPDASDPRLLSKKITVEAAQKFIKEARPVPFRFTTQNRRYQPNFTEESMSILEKKFIKAGLGHSLDTMKNRAFAAERHLIEKALLYPDKIDGLLDQLAGVVQGECDDARLFAQNPNTPYGVAMLRDVTTRLRKISENRPAMVEGEVYECLMGVAGLLTGECTIWWSEDFDLELTA